MTTTIQKVIELLRQAEQAAHMANASFGTLQPAVTLNTAEEIDAYVKEAVRLYMGSWVRSPILHALAILEVHDGLAKASRRLADVLHENELPKALDAMQSAIEQARYQEYRS